MPVTPEDRPLEVLREETIDRLIMNYGHGRLSLEAFQRRLDGALDAGSHAPLIEVTRDLDLDVDSGFVERKRTEFSRRDPVRQPAVEPDAAHDVEYVVDIFSGSDRSGEWIVPGEIRVLALFGGSNIDLTEARFSSPVTRIRMLCLFGGADVFVPEGVRTTVKAISVFGGMSNKAPDTSDPDAPRLIVEGLMIFGGGAVKVKRTFRERLLEFADGMRVRLGGGTSPR